METFTKQYISKLVDTLKKSDLKSISKIVDALDNAKGKIYIIGNGGSAATASHMVNDLGAGLRRRGIKSFDVESLSDNTPVCSALANDIGYKNIFYMQLKDRLKPEDILIAISCSGNSKNITKAVKYAKKIGSKIIGITGFDGGKLKKRSDINFHVETDAGEYGIVEDMHMVLNHIIYSYYISKA
ncbi:Sugar isomerase (SIS) [Sulfurimonas denitrificans DSM 1251]|jgi:D-sedoheptulose 7-phosphate isomerase|uniref:Sugar isomerase (SIS) n=1 Tax=Sulfurimonas denitrificans (strain ATCC 33889 / DSM 1251) TaxID=326298 RepID=Q30U66_SULDN|nr:SIS domain-containing protein [Sulfurimonas denitrificans]ABB43465.1 Sugar isomerase (SIS) [Sulfurimonas denitrificans DSM 1251]MDD3442937.1 SIS domain-containing protein [Sulfurimonas denitrificans]